MKMDGMFWIPVIKNSPLHPPCRLFSRITQEVVSEFKRSSVNRRITNGRTVHQSFYRIYRQPSSRLIWKVKRPEKPVTVQCSSGRGMHCTNRCPVFQWFHASKSSSVPAVYYHSISVPSDNSRCGQSISILSDTRRSRQNDKSVLFILHRTIDDVVLRSIYVRLWTNKHVHVSLVCVLHLTWNHVRRQAHVAPVSQQITVIRLRNRQKIHKT